MQTAPRALQTVRPSGEPQICQALKRARDKQRGDETERSRAWGWLMWLFHGESCAVGLFVAYYYSSNCVEASSQNNLVFCQKSSDLSSQLTTGSKTRLFRWKIKKETATCSKARYLEYKPFLKFVWDKCGQSFAVFYTRSPTAHEGNEHGKSSWRRAMAGRRLGRHSDSKDVCMRGGSW